MTQESNKLKDSSIFIIVIDVFNRFLSAMAQSVRDNVRKELICVVACLDLYLLESKCNRVEAIKKKIIE